MFVYETSTLVDQADFVNLFISVRACGM